MKRLERRNRGIDHVRLLADFSRAKGMREYTPDVLQAFADETSRELASILTEETRVAGIRGEAMFLAVVAGIGKVQLIKSEDEGDVYFQGHPVQGPDFRIVLGDGRGLLVEVKVVQTENLHAKFKLGDTYVQQLRRYAALMKTDLRVAIYWAGMRTWTLNSLEAFAAGRHGEKQWSIDFARAFQTSEMAVVGDRLIATPPPLRLRMNVKPEQAETLREANGSLRVAIAGVEFVSRDRPLSGRAAAIASKLLWHGNWVEAGRHVEQDGQRTLWIDHLFGPTADKEEWDDGCAMIGSLSDIISNAYLAGAASTIHTTTTSTVLEPGSMGQFIPDDFTKLDLPIALIELQPNLETT